MYIYIHIYLYRYTYESWHRRCMRSGMSHGTREFLNSQLNTKYTTSKNCRVDILTIFEMDPVVSLFRA